MGRVEELEEKKEGQKEVVMEQKHMTVLGGGHIAGGKKKTSLQTPTEWHSPPGNHPFSKQQRGAQDKVNGSHRVFPPVLFSVSHEMHSSDSISMSDILAQSFTFSLSFLISIGGHMAYPLFSFQSLALLISKSF